MVAINTYRFCEFHELIIHYFETVSLMCGTTSPFHYITCCCHEVLLLIAHEAGLATLQVACDGYVISNSVIFEYKLPPSNEQSVGSEAKVEKSNDNLLKFTLLQRLEAMDERLQIKQEPQDGDVVRKRPSFVLVPDICKCFKSVSRCARSRTRPCSPSRTSRTAWSRTARA